MLRRRNTCLGGGTHGFARWTHLRFFNNRNTLKKYVYQIFPAPYSIHTLSDHYITKQMVHFVMLTFKNIFVDIHVLIGQCIEI